MNVRQPQLLLLVLAACAAAGISGTVASADGAPLPATIMLDGIAWNTSARLPVGYFNRCGGFAVVWCSWCIIL
jgi:hypothetical protein